MADVDYRPALRHLLLRELAKRLRWSGFAYALFAALFSLNLAPPIRGVALCMAGLLAVLGLVRTLCARHVSAGLDVERYGIPLIHLAVAQNSAFGVFLAYATWHVWGQVIPECLLVAGVTGISCVSVIVFAPLPKLDVLSMFTLVAPSYIWSLCALPRYGWLLGALILFHAAAMAALISMNSTDVRDMFLARLSLEAQSEDLRQARDGAEKAGSARMRFLANMSHEIRTPLNGILGLAQVLNSFALTDEQRELLDDIGRSGHHLQSIVNDILDMAKVTSGKLSLEEVAFDLLALIHDLGSPAAALAENRHLRFLLQLPPDLPCMVKGDPLRTRQVVSNLLSNAVKFTPSGEIRLTVKLPREGWLCFEVSDTGIGLSPEQQKGLFSEFHQVDSSTTRKFGGSGLGLAISRQLAELMGGRLWVESRLGEGSTFYFELPIAATEVPPPDTESGTAQKLALTPGIRVLVVEDNRINQKVIANLVSQAGAHVEIAENGQRAVELHRDAPFNVILMDCQMPVMDGYEATALIRALPGRASLVPIIGVTANAFVEDRDRCIRAGMNGFVAKPLSRAALLAAVSEFILVNRT